MRLASKLFVASSLVVLVLVGVAVLSLRAIDRLVTVNRDITTLTVPALRAAATARDGVWALARLEARHLVLRDAQYAALWDEEATRVARLLAEMRGFATSASETTLLGAVTTAFEEYRRVVAEERGLLDRAQRQAALDLAETTGHPLIERMERLLESLMQATQGAVLTAQADAARLEARTWTGVLVALGAAVGLALLGTAVIAQRMTRSLGTLSAATTAVAAGSFCEPIPVTGADEIGDLGRSFNTMTARLRKMDETKQEFFARISHELRSPLTSVREAAHLLGDGVPGPLNAKQARLVSIISESTDRLLRLVNQLLELSRVRAGVLPLACERVDIERIVSRVLDELRVRADEAQVGLAHERLGEQFVVMGDEDRLMQVVVNLVSNAIRFTPPGGQVVVRLLDAGAEVEVQVEDNGVGIPAAALDTIFESYQQAHRNRGGTGLGLAIVRGMVEAHGGRVTVESQEGKGTRFTVLLPRTRDGGE
jgi:signal transduction histidine kinase